MEVTRFCWYLTLTFGSDSHFLTFRLARCCKSWDFKDKRRFMVSFTVIFLSWSWSLVKLTVKLMPSSHRRHRQDKTWHDCLVLSVSTVWNRRNWLQDDAGGLKVYKTSTCCSGWAAPPTLNPKTTLSAAHLLYSPNPLTSSLASNYTPLSASSSRHAADNFLLVYVGI